jgi:hypothetical protein
MLKLVTDREELIREIRQTYDEMRNLPGALNDQVSQPGNDDLPSYDGNQTPTLSEYIPPEFPPRQPEFTFTPIDQPGVN